MSKPYRLHEKIQQSLEMIREAKKKNEENQEKLESYITDNKFYQTTRNRRPMGTPYRRIKIFQSKFSHEKFQTQNNIFPKTKKQKKRKV